MKKTGRFEALAATVFFFFFFLSSSCMERFCFLIFPVHVFIYLYGFQINILWVNVGSLCFFLASTWVFNFLFFLF